MAAAGTDTDTEAAAALAHAVRLYAAEGPDRARRAACFALGAHRGIPAEAAAAGGGLFASAAAAAGSLARARMHGEANDRRVFAILDALRWNAAAREGGSRGLDAPPVSKPAIPTPPPAPDRGRTPGPGPGQALPVKGGDEGGPHGHTPPKRRVRARARGWTAAEDAILAAGVAEGLTARQLTERLPGRGRGPVVGRCHRLGLQLGAARETTRARPAPGAPKRKPPGAWTEAEIETLRDGARRGQSAAQIAARLPGRGSAALGRKAVQLGLAVAGESRGAAAGKRDRAPPPLKGLAEARDLERDPSSPWPGFGAPALRGGSRGNGAAAAAAVLALKAGQCKFPIGEVESRDFHFCGADRQPGQPYCAAHAALCFDAEAARRKARSDGAGALLDRLGQRVNL